MTGASASIPRRGADVDRRRDLRRGDWCWVRWLQITCCALLAAARAETPPGPHRPAKHAGEAARPLSPQPLPAVARNSHGRDH
jgi:hypothetical protein